MSTAARVLHSESRWALAWGWLNGLRRRWGKRPERQLRLSESLSLGERRFLAVVEFERQKFLIGGTPNSVSLLAELRGAMEHQAEQSAGEVWP
jgi:flagellar biogenesis protein FliO